MEWASVAVGEGREVYPWDEGSEADLVGVPLPREGKGHVRAPVEAVLEADDPRSTCMLAHDLYSVLYGLRAAVEQNHPLLEATWGDLGKLLGQVEVWLVVDHMDAAVDELSGLTADGLNHLVDAVAEACDTYSRREVDVDVTVHVLHDGSLGFCYCDGLHKVDSGGDQVVPFL